MNRKGTIRIGAVSYLNTKPLVHGLAERLPDSDIVYDLPSRLADQLATADLDVALIPSVEFFQNPAYSIVSDACIACRGPVWSVKLFSRVPGDQIRSLALDEGSRTSAALVQILLRERFGVTPELSSLPIEASLPRLSTPLDANGFQLAATRSDAILLIGDRAIHAPAGDWNFIWDLGAEWNRWSELPFVFAMWTARPGVDPRMLRDVDAALRDSRDAGLANLHEIAIREAPQIGLPVSDCLAYLRDNLYFYLGPREQQGLSLFYNHAAAMNLAPPDRRWRAVESTAA